MNKHLYYSIRRENYILLLAITIAITSINFLYEVSPTEIYTINNSNINTVIETKPNNTNHASIYINGNLAFNHTNGVTGGTGTMSDPYLIQNWNINATITHGIYITNTSAFFIIRNCDISDGKSKYQGIYLYNVSNGLISNSKSINNLEGIKFVKSNNNSITSNDISQNVECGLSLTWLSNNNSITNNHISDNALDGISIIYKCTMNQIINNTISYNYNGIHISMAYNSEITYNNICLNKNYGIRIESVSTNNIVCYNSFIENHGAGSVRNPIHVQAFDGVGKNIWNNSTEGNYWSDWILPDAHPKDGIVDLPYLLDGNNKSMDFYPLTMRIIIPDQSPPRMIIFSFILLVSLVIRMKSSHKKDPFMQ